MDDAIKLLGHEDIQLLCYSPLRLHAHMALNIELQYYVLNLAPNQFIAELIRTFPQWIIHRCAMDMHGNL